MHPKESKLRLFQALCLAFVLAFVPGTICCIAIAGGYSTYVEFERRRVERSGESGWSHESLVVNSDGLLAIRVVANRRGTSYLDENRQPLVVTRDDPHWLIGCSLWSPASLAQRVPFLRPRVEREIEELESGDPAQAWFFQYDPQTKSAVFEGFDTASSRPIGYLSPAGFQTDLPAEKDRFPVQGPHDPNVGRGCLMARFDRQYPYREYEMEGIKFDGNEPFRPGQWLLLSADRLFLVDAIARSVRELLPGSQVRAMTLVDRVARTSSDAPRAAGATRPSYEYQLWLAVLAKDRLVLLNPAAGKSEEYPLSAVWHGRDLDVHLPSDGSAVLTAYVPGSQRRLRPDLSEFDLDVASLASDGSVLQERRLTLQSGNRFVTSEAVVPRVVALAIPGPICSVAAIALLASITPVPMYNAKADFSGRLFDYLSQAWPALAVVIALALCLTWLADRRMRRFGLPRNYAVLVFVFLFGLSGYVGWLCHRRWPVRVRPEAPKLTGIEIFA